MSTATVRTLPATASATEVIGVVAEDGCCVVSDLAEPALMDAIHAELAPHIEATPMGGDEFTGTATTRTGSLLARSPSFRSLANHPLLMETLDTVLGDHATSYQLHLTQVIAIGAGESGQIIHRDQWAFDFFPFPSGYEVECHVMWAMTDFSEANGATRVIPGSHRWDDKLRPGYEETIPAEMTKGSVLVYVGSLYHGGGANRSSATRMGINVGYTLSWLRPEENQYLACPPEVARTLPEDLAKLAGYRKGAYALGYFGDVQDPMEAVHGRQASASQTFA
jgi:ectoine hydroxylase-related dioxygenase (phytanoyl-CoA dioxygenase family)